MGDVQYLHSDIAVVGWSCRLPGASSVPELWSMLVEERCAVTQIPPDRYPLQRYGHPRRQERGKSYTWAAGVLDDVWGFDPTAFGISPREAEQMDPQQRIILELAWEALEDAGIRPSTLAGTETGVYVGASLSEYAHALAGDFSAANAHFATGTSLAVIANRVSYALNLRGPSLSIDTACSSSLVALNQAVEALRSGRIDTAIVGGVNVLASPAGFVLFSQAMMLSPTGLCRAFSADADGYVRSEGGVVVVLRKASLAQRDGNPIHGIVVATDVNSDGHTHGISLPSDTAQEELLLRVYSRAGIDPNRLAFVEAHGTGTPAGDPVEARAIGRGLGRKRAAPLPIGSIKTNIGHLEPASGLAGMVKALLSLNRGVLPASLHSKSLSPDIPFDELNLAVAQQPVLLSNAEQSYAGVNSFGFGGTNAHVVVAAGRAAKPRTAQGRPPRYFTISAETKTALHALAGRYKDRLSELTDEDTGIVAGAAAHRRDRLSNRIVIASARQQDVVEALEHFQREEDHPLLTAGEAAGTDLPVAFVYSGNGSQWAGMGVAAYRHNEAFRSEFDRIDQHFKRLANWSMADALTADGLKEKLEKTSFAQPLIFAIQAGATAALRELGMRPAAALGHSVGEIAASYAAGILDLPTAAKVIFHRSAHQEGVYGMGRMAAVLGSRETLAPMLADFPDVAIAAVNSPRALTIAGPTKSLTAFLRKAASQGLAVLDLDLEYPFHSALMDPVEKPLINSLHGIVPRAGSIPFVSTVTGLTLPGTRLDGRYWWRNIREPVQFAKAIREAARLGARYFVEIGPRGMLARHISDSTEGMSHVVSQAVLHTGDKDIDPFPAVVAQALVAGAHVETSALFGHDPGGSVALPSYPWQHEKLHFTPTIEAVGAPSERERHPLAGSQQVADAAEWFSHIDATLLPDLADHKVGDQSLFPGTGFIDIAIFIARAWFKSDAVTLANFEIVKALDLTSQTYEVMSRVSPGSNTLEIFSRPRLTAAHWVLHCRCKMLQGHDHRTLTAPQLGSARATYDKASLYRLTAANGMPYGPGFQLAREVTVHDGNLIATELEPHDPDSPYTYDAVRLDCSMHGIFLVYDEVGAGKRGVAYVPVRNDEIVVLGRGMPQRAVMEVISRNERAIVVNYYLSGENNELLAVLRNVRCQAVSVKRPMALEAAGLIERPLLLDGALLGRTGVSITAREFIERAQTGITPPDAEAAHDAIRLIEGWATAAAYELAIALAGDVRVIPALLAEIGRLSSGLQPWLRTLLGHLEAAGLAQSQDGEWTLAHDALMPKSVEVLNALAREHPACAVELSAMGAVTSLIDKVRAERKLDSGDHDALFSPAALNLFNLASLNANSASQTLSGLLQAQSQLWPKSRALRVLQVGATRDAAVAPAMHAGHSIVLSVFEPDSARLECFRPLMARVGDVTFVEQADELAPQSYDLVIAAGALDRLCDRTVLLHLREALAPNGLFIAVEPRPSLFHDLAPGLSGHAGRSFRQHDWTAELEAAGFTQAVAASLQPDSATLLAAVAPQTDSAAGVTKPRRSVTIIDQRGARETELSAALARMLVAAGDEATITDTAAMRGNASAPNIVVHFPTAADEALGPVERLSARCLDMKACVENLQGKGTSLWFVCLGALSHPASKTQPLETAAWAFARTIANEFPQFNVRRIDVLPHVPPQTAAERIRDIILSDTPETELQIDSDVMRAVRADTIRGLLETSRSSPATAVQLQRHTGAGHRLRWTPADRPAPKPDDVEIEVEATGLNFRDVMWMLSLLPDDILEGGMSGPTMGLECAGKIVRTGAKVKHLAVGDSVMAMTAAGFASHVTVPARHVMKLPAGMSATDGATVPVTFFTAYYALTSLARLQRDEWVLIHGGAGGVGMAAIQLAQACGAKIIATAGSDAKRGLLRALGVEHVLDSRTMEFADEVKRITGGGADVVLNSLAGEAMERSIACLRPFGRFVELGKRDYVSNTHIGLRPFHKNLSYFGVDLDQVSASRPDICEDIYRNVMGMFDAGVLTPLPHTHFAAENVAEAFQAMQQSAHVGKIVVSPPAPSSIGIPPKAFEPNTKGTHLITGAFGGFGLETAKWLVARGVRHLVMIGRSAPSKDAQALLDTFRQQGVQILDASCDVSDLRALERLFAKVARTMPPLSGIIHSAMVLDDTILANLTAERLQRVLSPKVAGADHLDRLTRRMKLDYFVLFSTFVTYIGNPGQGNYVAANAYMEGIARRRRQDGLPALAIGWGPITDVGVLVRKGLVESSTHKLPGVRGMTASEGLELMAQALSRAADNPDLAVITIVPNDGGVGGTHLPVLKSPTYAALAHAAAIQGDAGLSRIDVRELLEKEGRDDVARIVADGIVVQLARVLHARIDDISRIRPLGEIGLDSLMALELAMGLETTFGTHISAAGQLTVAQLADEVIAQASRTTSNAADAMTYMAEKHISSAAGADAGALKELLNEGAAKPKSSSVGS